MFVVSPLSAAGPVRATRLGDNLLTRDGSHQPLHATHPNHRNVVLESGRVALGVWPCGLWILGRVAVGVWPYGLWTLGRVAVGVWPHGLWTLAVWRWCASVSV